MHLQNIGEARHDISLSLDTKVYEPYLCLDYINAMMVLIHFKLILLQILFDTD